MRLFTADELIAVVRRVTRAPNKDNSASRDTDFLNLLNEQLLAVLIPFVNSVKEEYFVVTRRQGATGAKRIRIPERAVGQQIRSLSHFENSEQCRFLRIERSQVTSYSSGDTVFYIEGNSIVFPFQAPASGEIEIAYMARPGQLVFASEARKITAVDLVAKSITVDSAVPASWPTQALFDIHSQWSGAEIKQISIPKDAVAENGLTITFTAAIDGTVFGSDVVQVGDYVCKAGEAAIPALPVELHPALAQAAAAKWLEQSDVEMYKAATETLNNMLAIAKNVLSDRVKSHPKRVAMRNPFFDSIQAGGYW